MVLAGHLGYPFASSAKLAPISEPFVAAVERFVRARRLPLLSFAKHQRKDDVAREYLARFKGKEGVLFVGKAQEKAWVFRTEKRRNAETDQRYPWIVRSTAMVTPAVHLLCGRGL